jgi:DNA-binding NtrC family response regulator
MSIPGMHKILIVDDEPSVRNSIRMALANDTRQIDAASTGEEANHLDSRKSYDLIIADLMMPGLSGLDLLKILKNRGSRARLILITGYPTIAAAEQAVAFGAFGFLPKPFQPAEIRAMVEQALRAEEAGLASRNGDQSG